MQPPLHILVIRFSSLGDVAMIVPVLKHLISQYPQLQLTIVSNASMAPLFDGLERCRFHRAYLKDRHRGLAGIFRLYKEIINQQKINAVADLHNVLRSRLLSFFLSATGYKVSRLDKGRKEKKQLTARENKICRQLTSMHERYASVFAKINLPVVLADKMPVYKKQQLSPAVANYITTGNQCIGIAPFAQYAEKMYPLERMKGVVKILVDNNYTILLFGAKGNEATILDVWESEMPGVKNIAGKFSLKEELEIISNLNAMMSMDSANMHLASLYGIPVVSIWGATHPYAGFYGWGQSPDQIVSVDLYCRPCSVFGNKPCYRGNHACMKNIDALAIVHKITSLLQ